MGVARIVGTGLGLGAAAGLGYYLGSQQDEPEVAVDPQTANQMMQAAQGYAPQHSRGEGLKMQLELAAKDAIAKGDVRTLRDIQYQYNFLTKQLGG